MANITMVGFGEDWLEMRDKIDTVMQETGWAGKCSTTNLFATTKGCAPDSGGRSTPYLIVYEHNLGLASHMAQVLRERLRVGTRAVESIEFP